MSLESRYQIENNFVHTLEYQVNDVVLYSLIYKFANKITWFNIHSF